MTAPYPRFASMITDWLGPTAKCLLYVEVEDGVVAASCFFRKAPESRPAFRFVPRTIRDAVYDFWERGDGAVKPRSWATIAFVIEHGAFNADFQYPDDLNPDEDQSDRRPRIVAAHFPGETIDYSAPGG